MRSPQTVLETLRKHAQKAHYQYERLYRNLYNPQLYLLAYQNLYANKGSMTPLSGEETMHISGDRDIKGGETESKGCYGRRLVDNTGAGKVKTPWNPKDSKAFLVDFW